MEIVVILGWVGCGVVEVLGQRSLSVLLAVVINILLVVGIQQFAVFFCHYRARSSVEIAVAVALNANLILIVRASRCHCALIRIFKIGQRSVHSVCNIPFDSCSFAVNNHNLIIALDRGILKVIWNKSLRLVVKRLLSHASRLV